MSVRTVAAKLVELCNQGKNFDLMHTMYTPDIVSVEGDGTETSGQAAVIKKSELWAAANEIHSQVVTGPFFNGPNQFATRFVFEVTRKATGEKTKLEELAVYWVAGDKIAREQFFYDGDH
ncbi:MAG TPA: nuclear transport factor 2 family protein [Polyangiales bacterium]|nr:nuclear transport factor 2 family protein [Polyangiales bacterium]